MKKEHSAIAILCHFKKNQRHSLQSKHMYGPLLGMAFLCMLLISACSTESYSDNSAFMTDDSETQHNRYARESANLGDSIKNSYARLASERSDVCPKLIEDSPDGQVIERLSEVMVDNYCDYYLYPQDGQHLWVDVDDSRIEALLIVPTIHHFDNGSYEVKSYDKHVIRLSYNGATHKPENLNYDVAITIADNRYF